MPYLGERQWKDFAKVKLSSGKVKFVLISCKKIVKEILLRRVVLVVDDVDFHKGGFFQKFYIIIIYP